MIKFKFLCATLFALNAARLSAALDLYVSTTGNDANTGSINAPFATITKAQSVIRGLNASNTLPTGGVTVWLRGGYYELSTAITFDGRDSGASDKRIVYASYTGETARIAGARRVDPSWFTLVGSSSPVWSSLDPVAQGKVYVADLRAHGITDFGTLKNKGTSLPAIAPAELIWNSRPAVLARWPNRGQTLVRTVTAPSASSFTYEGNRPNRWANAPEIWFHGFWGNTHSDHHVKAAGVDTATQTVTFVAPPSRYGTTAGRPYYAYNLLQELDEAGEYYIDRAAGLLYVWPTTAVAGADIQLTMLETPIFCLWGASNLTFRNLTIEGSRSGLVQIATGNSNKLEACLLRNAGQYAVSIDGSFTTVDGCDVSDCGEQGILVKGGIRRTLTPGGNLISNSHLQRNARISWSNYPAVSLDGGCGNIVSHNLINDMPHQAVMLTGNNHLIEFNEITRVCQVTSDAGAIYTGRDWGYRGNAIRQNFIHHIQSTQEGSGVYGVYLDDCVSGIEISKNVFHQISDAAIMVGGGRDNIMTNNIFSSCGIAHYNSDYARNNINDIPGDPFNLLERLAADGIAYQAEPWASAYPACARIPNSWPQVQIGLWRSPENCVFDNNAGWANRSWTIEKSQTGNPIFSIYASMANNKPDNAELFTEAASIDRPLRSTSLQASNPGFSPIAFSTIGPPVLVIAPVLVAPQPAALQANVVSSSRIDLTWSIDASPSSQPTSLAIERRNLPDGTWQTVATFGSAVTATSLTGLAGSTGYALRIMAKNAAGSTPSNWVAATTLAPPPVLGTAVRTEAENPLTIVSDGGTAPPIGVSDSTLDSGKSVRLYDVGDAVRVSFSAPTTGQYKIMVRVRSGQALNATAFWPNGYRIQIDGVPTPFTGDPSTVSPLDSGSPYGNHYWGTMVSNVLTLTAGSHSCTVTAGSNWAVLDYIEVAPLGSALIQNYSAWKNKLFSADQQANTALSGPSARPVGDNFSNMVKYALGLNPWTRFASSGVVASRVNNRLQLQYTHAIGLTDTTFVTEVSVDNVSWSALTAVPTSQTATTQTMLGVDQTALASTSRYIRLRIVPNGVSGAASSYALTFDLGVSGNTPIPMGAEQPGVETDEVSSTSLDSFSSVSVESLQYSSAAEGARLINLSMRARVGSGDLVPIAGFIIAGDGNCSMLLRGAGPSLAAFDVAGAVADPLIRLYQGGTKIGENDNWSAADSLITSAKAGAFGFPSASKDAALLRSLPPGGYTVHLASADNRGGVGLFEIFDNTPSTPARLVNLSARAQVGRGADVLIIGFVVEGTGSTRVLIRGVGPTLATFGVSNYLANPSLAIHHGDELIASNNDWSTGSGATVVQNATAAVNAFALPSNSKDAAVVLDLTAGAYTALIKGEDEGEGVALLELYEVK